MIGLTEIQVTINDGPLTRIVGLALVVVAVAFALWLTDDKRWRR